jgi:cob(I)alamin adenosyltransferase
MEQGLLHLYYGDGKGKTTAAMGLALRALGSGKRVVIVQFLKGGNSGEIPLLAKLGAEIYRGKAGQKFVFQMNEAEKAATRELQNRNLRNAMPICWSWTRPVRPGSWTWWTRHCSKRRCGSALPRGSAC